MCDLRKFFDANPRSGKTGPFSAAEVAEAERRHVPKDIVDFLLAEGRATYLEGFLFTTLPQDHDAVFDTWGIDGTNCHAFLRTAFGGLIYSERGKIRNLDPLTSNLYKSNFDFCKYMNITATTDVLIDANHMDVYAKAGAKTLLNFDEIYAFVPALPLGGSFQTSTLEVVKMREHLALLAQLFDNKVNIL